MDELEELKDIISGYDRYYERNGATEELVECYAQACLVAFDKEWVEYGLELTKKAKNYADEAFRNAGFDGFFDVDYTCNATGQRAITLDWYYTLLKLEAPYNFDSYMLYLEKNRPNDRRFYANRAETFRKLGIVQAMQDLEDDKLDILSISLPPSTGKALPMDAKVLTPKGYVRNDSLQVGDEVIAGNGNVAKVLGVYPQGKKKMYKVVFNDRTWVKCSEEHLWWVKTRDDRKRNGKYRVIPLNQIMQNYKVENGKRSNYSIDCVKPIPFEEKEFKIHPYILGVLIGNGYISETPKFSTADKEVVDNVSRFMANGYSVKYVAQYDYSIQGHDGNNCKAGSLYSKELKRYGLFGKKSHEKFIPRDYLYGSVEQRLWLLRGLIDTDGWVSHSNPVYTTASKQLADDVAELVRSLGGTAFINHKTNCGYKKDGIFIPCKDSYNICIQFTKDIGQIATVERKKYYPKKEVLRRFIDEIIPCGEEECQCIYISDDSHLYITDDYIITHNTTLEVFFASWVCGRHIEDYSLFFTHSSEMADIFYRGVLDIVQSDEYLFSEIFPNCTLNGTDAKAKKINFGGYKPYYNIQCTSVGAQNAGKVRANRYLFCDDMISSIEEALNRAQLDKIWRIYTSDARQRKKNQQVKEIHIATRWSVHDVIGRLKEIYAGDDRARFIACPDINPVTGESNFNYRHEGMTTEFFNDIALTMDDITYQCLYKNEPIEREGLLYNEDELRRYDRLPEREPDAILSICDTKTTGIDYMFLPVMYQYGDDYYCEDCICDDSTDFDYQYTRLTNILLDHKVQQCEFESNAGGSRIAHEVRNRIESEGGRCNVTEKPTETNKETRIIVNSDWIKRHVLFKESERYTPKSDYGKMMKFIQTYSIVGKNKFDDCVDGLANFALFVTGKRYRRKTKIIGCPF